MEENTRIMPLIRSFDHVQVTVPFSGVEQAKAFYGGVLELVEIPKPEVLQARGGAWYRCGDQQLHLGLLEENSGSSYLPPQKAHAAFLVSDLEILRQRLKGAGAPVTLDLQIPGFQRFYTLDPFGNRLEFLQRQHAGEPGDVPANDAASVDGDESARVKERVRQMFGRAADAYVTSTSHASGDDLAKLLELAAPRPSDRGLDISAGGGHTALAVAPHVASVVASDLTPRMLEAARAFITARGVGNVSYVIADAEQLPFLDASFDLVTVRIAPHHYANVQAAVSEMARVLVPGGRLIVIDNIAPEDSVLDQAVNDWEKRRDPSHVRAYTVSEWRTFLDWAGLQVQSLEVGSKPIDFASWTERMQMPAEASEQLAADMLGATQPVHEHFKVRGEGGRLVSWSSDYVVLLATK